MYCMPWCAVCPHAGVHTCVCACIHSLCYVYMYMYTYPYPCRCIFIADIVVLEPRDRQWNNNWRNDSQSVTHGRHNDRRVTYLSKNVEIMQKKCLKTIFTGYPYENILQMVNLPRLHRRRDELCRVYFAKIKSNYHKLNALLRNGRSVPYALRLCNKLPIPRAKTNHYKHSLILWCLEHFHIG